MYATTDETPVLDDLATGVPPPPLDAWVTRLLEQPELTRMGHAQRKEDGNLGLGWLYYALGRMLRPATAVVIGSYRGFVPLVLARALADNVEAGRVIFIDPSLVDDFWTDAQSVQRYFASLDVGNISHYLMTTQQFVASPAYHQTGEVGLVFIDGFHSAEQARFDFEAFAGRLAAGGMILLHDSVWRLPTGMYGPERAYTHSVVDFIDDLKRQPQWQVFDLPLGDGVTLVRRAIVPPAPVRRSGRSGLPSRTSTAEPASDAAPGPARQAGPTGRAAAQEGPA